MAVDQNHLQLDNCSRIVCPYCGRSVRVNDLLFRGKKKPIFYDRKRVQYYLDITDTIPSTAQAYELFCWREFRSEDILLEEGIVVGVVDTNGTEFRERVCVMCHNHISAYWMEQEFIGIYADDLSADFFDSLEGYHPDIKKKSLFPPEIGNSTLDYIKLPHSHIGIDMNQKCLSNLEKSRLAYLENSFTSVVIVLSLREEDIGESVYKPVMENMDIIRYQHFRDSLIVQPVLFVLRLPEGYTAEDTDKYENAVEMLRALCRGRCDAFFWDASEENDVDRLVQMMEHFFETDASEDLRVCRRN